MFYSYSCLVKAVVELERLMLNIFALAMIFSGMTMEFLGVFVVSYRIVASPYVDFLWVLVVFYDMTVVSDPVTFVQIWRHGAAYAFVVYGMFLLRFLRLLSLVVHMICNGLVLLKHRLDLRRPCIWGRVFGYPVIYRAFSTLSRLSTLWFQSDLPSILYLVLTLDSLAVSGNLIYPLLRMDVSMLAEFVAG
ncbi:hypothetical protein Bca101_042956 [Brassica carinata]